jgi:hypothetical protein
MQPRPVRLPCLALPVCGLCLLQFTTGKKAAMVNPFAQINLTHAARDCSLLDEDDRRRRDASGRRAKAQSHRGYQVVIVAALLNHLFFLKKTWVQNYISIIIYVPETLFRSFIITLDIVSWFTKTSRMVLLQVYFMSIF